MGFFLQLNISFSINGIQKEFGYSPHYRELCQDSSDGEKQSLLFSTQTNKQMANCY